MIAAIFLWPPLPGPLLGAKGSRQMRSALPRAPRRIGSGPLLNSQTGLSGESPIRVAPRTSVASFSQLPMYTPLPITWASKPPGVGLAVRVATTTSAPSVRSTSAIRSHPGRAAMTARDDNLYSWHLNPPRLPPYRSGYGYLGGACFARAEGTHLQGLRAWRKSQCCRRRGSDPGHRTRRPERAHR